MNKQGDVAVTLFCILGIALLGFALFYFMTGTRASVDDFYDVGAVRENNKRFDKVISELNDAMEKAVVKSYDGIMSNADILYEIDDKGVVSVMSDEKLNEEFIKEFKKNLKLELDGISLGGEEYENIKRLVNQMFYENSKYTKISFDDNLRVVLEFDNEKIEEGKRFFIKTSELRSVGVVNLPKEVVIVLHKPRKIKASVDLNEIGLERVSLSDIEESVYYCDMNVKRYGDDRRECLKSMGKFENFEIGFEGLNKERGIVLTSKKAFYVDGSMKNVVIRYRVPILEVLEGG